jgi:hypothetical protein
MGLRDIVIVAVAAGLAGCAAASIPSTPVASMPPMNEPVRKVGYQEHGRLNGKEVVSTLVSETPTERYWSRNDGCSSRLLKSGFAPSLAWAGCPGSADGTQTAILKGDVWPLSLGKKWSYAFKGADANGNQWTGDRSCAVEGARIRTALGELDTFQVTCRDPWSTYSYFVSPQHGTTVYFERLRRRDGDRQVFELTRAE